MEPVSVVNLPTIAEGPVYTFAESECSVRSDINLFKFPLTDCSEFSKELSPHFPIYNLVDQSVPLEFVVENSGQQYLDLASSFLSLECRLLKGSPGTAVPVTELVTVDNNLFQSMFTDMSIYWNDSLVYETSNMYHHIGYISRLVQSSSAAKEGELTREFWYPSTIPGTFNLDEPGFAKRHELTKGSRLFNVSGRLAGGHFDNRRPMLPGVSLRISLKRNTAERMIVAGVETEAGAYTLEIVRATFYACKKTMLKRTIDNHRHSLSRELKAIYPIKELAARSYIIPKGHSTFEADGVTMGKFLVCYIIGSLYLQVLLIV